MPDAIAGVSSSSPPAQARAGQGFLRVVSPGALQAQETSQRQARDQANSPQTTPDLGAYIRQQFYIFRNHRNTGTNCINERLLRTQRMFEGKYDADKLREIQKFGGSEVYARIVAGKCRGATSLLRDVYLGASRPWDIQSQPDPPIPDGIQQNIAQLVATEVQTLAMAGQPVVEDQVHMRTISLLHAAQAAARRNADMQAEAASDKIEDILVAGKFYSALTEFLIDLPLFPFACIKGPVVRMMPKITWNNRRPSIQNKAQMYWERVNPFFLFWSPGASTIEDADIIERKRLTRADLNDLIGLPGYDENAVRAALQDYARGLRDWMDWPDTEQALNEGRENPDLNRSQYIDAIEYHGKLQGALLLEQGVDAKLIPDPDRDYSVQSWVVGKHTIKTQLNPSPRQRHPYYATSYEKMPGVIAGHAIPEIIEDIQEVANASLRAAVNNLAIASGPQVVVNDEMVSPTENADELYPWKRWHVQGDPLGNQRDPISFFQPQSYAGENLGIYQQMTNLADELSGIPRYITGSERLGGAGRTASGLSMLMGNASKNLQTVAGNVDTDVMEPVLSGLYDMIMLTDQSGILTGEEQIRVRGVSVAVQRETENQKQLQFLQITANPIDAPIVGMIGRARVLRALAQSLGLPDDVVPDDKTLQEQQDAQKQMMQAGQALQAAAGPGQGQAAQPGHPGGPEQAQPGQGGAPGAPSMAAQAQGMQPQQATPAQHSDHAPPVNVFQQQPGVHY